MTDKSADRQHSCPNCGSESVRRSARIGFLEKVVYRLLALRPYRCAVCETRFFDRAGGKSRKGISQQ